jgi:hypothetical protein
MDRVSIERAYDAEPMMLTVKKAAQELGLSEMKYAYIPFHSTIGENMLDYSRNGRHFSC